MAFDFPSSPTTGQQYTPAGGPTYVWNGYAWAAQSPIGGTLGVNVRTFTVSGTYTPTPGLQFAVIECIGGGGGGGGVYSNGSYYFAGGGGGSGGYSRARLTAAQIGASQIVTIGAGGIAGLASVNFGGTGGDTSFGALCLAKGGLGGERSEYAVAGIGGGGAGAPVAGAIGDVVFGGDPGGTGAFSTVSGTGLKGSGQGGSSALGGGGSSIGKTGVSVQAGDPGANYGSGGSGGFSWATVTTTTPGGAGSAGIVIITEYLAVVAAGAAAQSGLWVLLDTKTANNSPSLDFTANITSLYDEYQFVGHGLMIAANTNTDLISLFSQNAGVSWDTASNYGFAAQLVTCAGSGSGVSAAVGANTTTNINLMISQGSSQAWSSAVPATFDMKLYRPASTTLRKILNWTAEFYTNVNNAIDYVTGGGYYTQTSAVNGVRFVRSDGGNIASGEIRMYGRAK